MACLAGAERQKAEMESEMKRTFLTTAALILSVSAAAAEVKVSGDARLGLRYDGDRVQHTSRVRVKFELEEKTDNGLTFGASVRADQASDAKSGAAGTVYASGSFGKISFGGNDSASYNANGEDLLNINLIGQDDADFKYFATKAVGKKNPNILYEYTAGDATFYASVMDGDAVGDDPEDYEDAVSLGAKYTLDKYTVGVGYEQGTKYDIERAEEDKGDVKKGDIVKTTEIDNTRVTASLEAKFDAFKLKGMFSTGELGDKKITQYGGSGEYSKGDYTYAAYVKQQIEEETAKADVKTHFGGIGASYALNEHASIKGGIAVKKEGGETTEYADLGIALKF